MQQNLWKGLPDILLARYDENEELAGLMIGECKYTRNIQEIKKRLLELLEYLYYVKYDGSYILEPKSEGEQPSGTIPVNGCVFVDQLSEEATDASVPISLLEYGSDYEIPWSDFH